MIPFLTSILGHVNSFKTVILLGVAIVSIDFVKQLCDYIYIYIYRICQLFRKHEYIKLKNWKLFFHIFGTILGVRFWKVISPNGAKIDIVVVLFLSENETENKIWKQYKKPLYSLVFWFIYLLNTFQGLLYLFVSFFWICWQLSIYIKTIRS